ncbi:DUF2066 domain-containing protein [Rhodanobacter sp. DHB23]|uniref:DUF2066 domain-containing protein n=1 Tax=Rhodanobacter sp. DHB23 TaxID=2775923 RepID=UPI001CE1E8C9|nr:DUF2066 domain-containing protein [Rhodanobacter sp. DHB23]
MRPFAMRLLRLFSVVLLLGLAGLSPVHAQNASPYSVTVPVTDTSDTQRGAAFASALSQVLARVAGGQDLRGKPGYDDALKNAAALVLHFQYARATTGMNLAVDFEPGAVRHLVSQLGVADNAGGKPPVLLMVRGSDGQLLDKDALASLAGAAAARGYGVAYVDPAGAPDPAKVDAADPATLVAINQQYHTGLVLLGSLHGGGADWTLVSGGKAQRWSDKAATEDALMADAGNGMVDRIGQQLNVIGSTVNDEKLWVSGLVSAMDYANLLSLLDNDPSVRGVAMLGADNDGMLFEVKSVMPADALAANLAASGRLIRGEAHPDTDASLQWLH